MRRSFLVRAHTLGTSLTGLLANSMVGTIFLDHRGKIVKANSRARKILRQGKALSDRGGVLHARSATDDITLAGAFLAAGPAQYLAGRTREALPCRNRLVRPS